MNPQPLFSSLATTACAKLWSAKRRAILGLVLLATVRAGAADLVWIGGTGNWDAAANWSPAQLPTAADHVFLTNNGTYTVTIDQVDPTVASLTVGGTAGTQTLFLDRTTLTLNGASVINTQGELQLSVATSVLAGAGNLTVTGTFTWTRGEMTGAGVTTIGSSGFMTIGGNADLVGRTLNNSGSLSWNAGAFALDSGAVLNNLASATFSVNFDGNLAMGGSPVSVINNAGLFRKTAGSARTDVDPQFNNTGTVLVQAGTLSLNGGGTHAGAFSDSAGATANFGGGSHVLTSASLVTGSGVLAVSGNATTLAAGGNFDLGATLNVTAGAATLTSSANVTSATVTVSGGVLNFNTASSVAVVNVTAGTLGGPSPVNVTGPLTLSGGTISNPLVTANGGLNLTGGFTLNGGKLINPATAIWSAGNFTGANGAVFSNLLGATFTITFDGNAPSGSGVTPVFVNDGLLQKTNGSAPLGTTSIDFTFLNTGTVEVRTNTLRYNSNQQTAGLTLLDGGNLTAQAQPLQFLGGSLMGTGLVSVANAQNVINASAISPGLPIGELDIAGNYQQTAAGTLNLDLGGYLAGTDFDLITVTAGGAGGVATLGGTLKVSLTNGFSPTNGATFTFLTANSRVGVFSTFNYPSNEIGMLVSYDLTSAKLTVSNLKPVVANPILDPAAITYGGALNFQLAANTFADPDGDPLTYGAIGLPPGVSFSGATRIFSGAPTQAGIFPVTVTATDNGSPSLAVSNTFTLTINPATLTIAAQSQSKVYGAADPVLTFTTDGLQLSDTAGAVLTGTLTRATGEAVTGSPYAITQGTLVADSNYAINFTGSTLTITSAALSVTADGKTKIYGAVDPAFTATYGGFVNGETPEVLGGTLAFTRPPGQNVGSYLITPSGLTSGNYAISFNPGTLGITPAVLSITANPISKTYGALDPALTFAVTGLQFGDPAASALTGGLTRVGGETAVGSPYTIAQGTLTPNANYTADFTGNTLTITPATLSITAEDKTKIYGAADPAFTVTYAGFVNGEAATVLGGALAFTRALGENVGSYLITPSGLSSGNYAITFNPGTLSVTPAVLTVTAAARTKVYGAADPALTFAVSGLQFSDTSATILTGALARTPGESVVSGPYAITQGTLTPDGNYTIGFNGNSLTITSAPLSVTVDAKTKIFATPDPAFTVSYAGFVNAESPVVLTGTLAFNRAPGEGVGSYLVTPSGLTSGNYTITFNPGMLTIAAPAPLMLSPALVSTTNIVISWTAVSNATYRVQQNPVLSTTNWIDFVGDVTATGSSASKTDTLTTTNRFYRVRVLP